MYGVLFFKYQIFRTLLVLQELWFDGNRAATTKPRPLMFHMENIKQFLLQKMEGSNTQLGGSDVSDIAEAPPTPRQRWKTQQDGGMTEGEGQRGGLLPGPPAERCP